MRFSYDTEFLEDGQTIELLSIGIVREDGDEYYAINEDFRLHRLLDEPWLLENVVPSLPIEVERNHAGEPISLYWNFSHPDGAVVLPRNKIRGAVRDFLLSSGPDPELWAWFGAYDHVALTQLWGRMIDRPEGLPWWTNDIRQECQRLGNPRLPEQENGLHNALDDARFNWMRLGHLEGKQLLSAR